MAVEGPSKTDVQLVFKKLRAIPTNKVCFDCNAKNPTWASVTYGVFICLDCSAVHRALGVHLSFVRSTQLDTNWTWLQLRQMQFGGNANANCFFRQHNCTTTDSQQKYNSRAAQLYQEKLSQLATQALRTYGTQLIIENTSHESTAAAAESSQKEVFDFFAEHTNSEDSSTVEKQNIVNKVVADDGNTPALTPVATEKPEITSEQKKTFSISQEPVKASIGAGGAPSVENAFTSSSVTSSDAKSHIIKARTGAIKRSSLGAKKGGLGAQKVKANFADIERDAALADQIKFSEKQDSVVKNESPEDQVNSVRLAYQDLSVQQKREEDKLKQIDPKKAEQIERLGMGFNTKSGVSHSALNDMKTLDADIPTRKDTFVLDRTDDDDFFECFTNIPVEFRDLGSLLAETGKSKKKISSWKEDVCDIEPLNLDRPTSKYAEPLNFDRPKNKSMVTVTYEDQLMEYGSKNRKDDGRSSASLSKSYSTSTKNVTPAADGPSSGEAQKKFGTAKSISSAQYFGDGNNMGEERMNLCQFEGSTSISSAELFGRTSVESSSLQAPDFDDVKESVRMGVTKVAGKLSSLANGVMSSIQERYGGY